MTTKDDLSQWWLMTSDEMTFDEWLRLWKMKKLSLKARVMLLKELSNTTSMDADNGPKTAFLTDLFMDTKMRTDCHPDYAAVVAELAAEQLVTITLGGLGGTINWGSWPALLIDVLKILKRHCWRDFDNMKKQLRHQVKEWLRLLYVHAHQPSGATCSQETKDSNAAVRANLHLLIECLCAYRLYDVIEDTSDKTLALLEEILDKQNYRNDRQIEEAAYSQKVDNYWRDAARQLLYLRSKRAYLDAQKPQATSL